MYQQSNRLIGVFKVLDKAQTCILNHAMKHANFGLQTTMVCSSLFFDVFVLKLILFFIEQYIKR